MVAPSRGVTLPLAHLIPRSGARPLPVRSVAARIGADSVADVVLQAPTVAPVHAALRLDGGVWTLEDLGSAAGSWVDGAAVTEAHPVAPGSVVRLGEIELIFDPQDAWSDSLPTTPAPAAPVDERVRRPAAPIFMIDEAPTGQGWLPWVLVGAVVILAVAAILLAGGSR